MNERLKQLADEAREYATTRHPVSNTTLSVNSDLFEQKFAELIVRECITVINQPNGVGDDDVIRISRDVKKHFGVKEQVTEPVELHTCPYAAEIHGDYETLCDCDFEQTYQCAMDI